MRTTPYASRLYRRLLQLTREVFQDFKYTLRLWASRPWHPRLAITALAIGIGANTGVFSVVDALLLRSLPFYEPDRLALLHQFIPPHDSAKEFHDWRQRNAYLTDAALFEENDVNVGGVRVLSRAHLAQTSWNFFRCWAYSRYWDVDSLLRMKGGRSPGCDPRHDPVGGPAGSCIRCKSHGAAAG